MLFVSQCLLVLLDLEGGGVTRASRLILCLTLCAATEQLIVLVHDMSDGRLEGRLVEANLNQPHQVIRIKIWVGQQASAREDLLDKGLMRQVAGCLRDLAMMPMPAAPVLAPTWCEASISADLCRSPRTARIPDYSLGPRTT